MASPLNQSDAPSNNPTCPVIFPGTELHLLGKQLTTPQYMESFTKLNHSADPSVRNKIGAATQSLANAQEALLESAAAGEKPDSTPEEQQKYAADLETVRGFYEVAMSLVLDLGPVKQRDLELFQMTVMLLLSRDSQRLSQALQDLGFVVETLKKVSSSLHIHFPPLRRVCLQSVRQLTGYFTEEMAKFKILGHRVAANELKIDALEGALAEVTEEFSGELAKAKAGISMEVDEQLGIKVAPLQQGLKDCAAAAAKLEGAASEDRQSIQNQVQACARV